MSGSPSSGRPASAATSAARSTGCHEVAHSLGPPPGRRTPEQLISDAVLTYQLAEAGGQTSIAYRFIELDRATRSAADLAHRLGRYARLYRRTVPVEGAAGGSAPLWSRLYPVFPTVLVVLAGRPSDRLEDRRRTVLALCGQDPDLAETPEVEVSICLLDDLADRGPFAPICRTLADPGKAVDWLGEGRADGRRAILPASARGPAGVPVLRADERFVEALAATLAEQVADRLHGRGRRGRGLPEPRGRRPLHLRPAQAHPRTDQRRPAYP